VWAILHPERIGITLTEAHQMVPEQSTSAIIVWHPEASYYSVRTALTP
jgi:5-methyltetrahydrofolate--homocysteine methyltransferase